MLSPIYVAICVAAKVYITVHAFIVHDEFREFYRRICHSAISCFGRVRQIRGPDANS